MSIITKHKDFISNMKIAFAFCVSYVCASVSNALAANSLDIHWSILAVHKEVDNSIVHSIKRLGSIIECASICSSQPPKDRVSLYYIPETGLCHCNLFEDLMPENTSANLIQYGTPIIDNSDCLSLYEYGYEKDGVYSITGWLGGTLYVQCDMINGGWTIIQTRFDGSIDFYRNWSDYVSGFGDIYGEHWIGLDNIHHLTTPDSELSVYVETYPGITPASASAIYSHFAIGDSTAKYILDVDGYSGTCGDSITELQNGMKFTTFDNDNDLYAAGNCAVYFYGGWWHNTCFCSNLNGMYFQSGVYQPSNEHPNGLHWCSCWSFQYSAKITTMKVRRN